PHVAPLPAQVHVADPAVGFGDQGVDHRGALVAGVVAGPQDKIGQGPVFAVVAGGPQKGLPLPGGQDGQQGTAPIFSSCIRGETRWRRASGSMTLSESTVMKTSPRPWLKPAYRASFLPRLAGKWMALTRWGKRRQALWINSQVSSREPSSMQMISRRSAG